MDRSNSAKAPVTWSLDDLSICCCQPGADKTDDRRPPEVVAMHKQFLVYAVPATGEQF